MFSIFLVSQLKAELEFATGYLSMLFCVKAITNVKSNKAQITFINDFFIRAILDKSIQDT
jgi:hypothetical protein